MTADALDRTVRAELSGLPKGLSDIVARHLVMTGRLIDEDPEAAYEHAKAAQRHAARIAVVRESLALAAYATARYEEALAEFRAHRRLSGSDAYIAVVADCERGRGQPRKALELARSPRAEKVDHDTRIELLIVAAGARRDMGQHEAAMVSLRVPALTSHSHEPWASRLKYAYADALLGVGNIADARMWFEQAAAVDLTGETDALERLTELSPTEDTRVPDKSGAPPRH